MPNNSVKRELTIYGSPTVIVTVAVYGHDTLMPEETRAAADDLTDRVMLALSETRYVKASLSRIDVKRKRA